jgi:hemoglobin-like flavoprotein
VCGAIFVGATNGNTASRRVGRTRGSSVARAIILQSIIAHSGRQHAQFGVKSSHFDAFGDALMWGLEQELGAAFTPALKDAWITLYRAVQSEMIRAAGLKFE